MNGTTLCISTEGDVYSFGGSTYGAHGHKEEKVLSPTRITSLTNILAISCGPTHSLCLDYAGNVFSFGSNSNGELGIGKPSETFSHTCEPQHVNVPSSIKQVSCGRYFSICVSEKGEIFSFGANNFGQLGQGNNDRFYFPKLIEGICDIEFVACGQDYSICKTINNDIYSWGSNEEGQLGIGDRNYKNTPVKCAHWSDEIVDIKCGKFHSLMLTSRQQVFSCGNNEYGQLSRSTETKSSNGTYSPTFELILSLKNIHRIECGNFFSMCIDIDGNFFVFGLNSNGQLGLGDIYHIPNATKHPSLSKVIDISSGGTSTFVKTPSSKIYAFGCNEYNEIGDHRFPVQIFKDNEDIWSSNLKSFSRVKSARTVIR